MRAILAALLCLCACQSAAAEAIPLRYGQAYSERDRLSGGALTGAKAKQRRDDGTHESSLHAGRLRQGSASPDHRIAYRFGAKS